jgi:hypothetical protein
VHGSPQAASGGDRLVHGRVRSEVVKAVTARIMFTG